MRTIRQRWLRGTSSGALSLVAIALSAYVVEAQGAHFTVLTIPPENVGTCLPPMLSAPPTEKVRQGNRLVIRNPEPFMTRDISTMTDSAGRHTGLSDRTQVITAHLRSKGASVIGSVLPDGSVWGFLMESTHSVPDSVLQAQDLATMRRILDSGTGTMARRELDTAEQRRVRSLIDYMRKRCP